MFKKEITGRVCQIKGLRNVGETTVLNFSIVYDYFDLSKKEKTPIFINVACFGKRGESLSAVLRKGAVVSAEGTFKVEIFKDKPVYNLVANDVRIFYFGPDKGESVDHETESPDAAEEF